MRVVAQSDIVNSLPSLLEDFAHENVPHEAVAIQSDGRNVAFVISPEEYETIHLARNQRLIAATERLSSRIAERAEADGLDLGDLMRSLDRKAS